MEQTMRRFFAGVNSTAGFYSSFSSIMPLRTAKSVLCLKGGPGTGKSTFLKKLAHTAADMGYDVNVFHCSSDPESLDGVSIPHIGVAAYDATAPHMCDPELPGIKDEILNLGAFWDKQKLRENTMQIERLVQMKKQVFKEAYSYFAAIKPLFDHVFYKQHDYYAVLADVMSHIDQIFPSKGAPKEGIKLFCQALTPDGDVNHLESLMKERKVISVYPAPFSSHILSHVARILCHRGYDCTLLYSYYDPHSVINHIICDDVVITGEEIEESIQFPLDAPLINGDMSELIGKLKNGVCVQLQKAREYHMEIEKYYVEAMDFNRLENTVNQTINQLLGGKCEK